MKYRLPLKEYTPIRNMSLSEFEKGATFFYPGVSKVLWKGKKAIAVYSSKTKKVTKL